jgi:MFS family permease
MTATDVTATPRLGAGYRKLFAASTVSNLGDGIGMIAYPWLASAVTRNPILISLVVVAQRLPWLVFSLPAGVITDRFDRRTLMVRANVARAALTLVVSFVVLSRQGSLPGPDEIASGAGVEDDLVLYGLVVAATLLMGMAEVLYDNSAQTFMPSIVAHEHLERANGRLWSAEQIANAFVGPPLGSFLLIVSFSVPFFVDGLTFAMSAVLIAMIPVVARPATEGQPVDRLPWRTELAEGVRWLWRHELLRPMAIILGLLNMLGTLSGGVLVLFAQEVLETSPTEFAVLGTGGAVGAVLGGWTAGTVSKRLGTGPSLGLTLVGGAATSIVIGFSSQWLLVWLMFAVLMFVGVLWNVITVSLRQAIIPDHLLGRVNSVYRFFAWGMMPIGALIGGLVVASTELVTTREMALRAPWFVAGIAQLLLLGFAAPRLTSEKLDGARRAAAEAAAG